MPDQLSRGQAHVVVQGRFGGLSVVSVLQALSISRQLLAVELFNKSQTSVGRVLLKSNMILDVQLENKEENGVEALQILLKEPLDRFQVERLPPLDSYPKPISRLDAQLSAPAERVDGRALPRGVTQPPMNPPSQIPVQPSVGGRSQHVQEPRPRAAPRPTTQRRKPGPPIIAIASPKGGCGKTTIALNLAVGLARSKLKVALIDTDPNGDVLSALNARERARAGIFDLIAKRVEPESIRIQTRVQGLQIIPAISASLAMELSGTWPVADQWHAAFLDAAPEVDVILVDVPAGMFGLPGRILQACNHVVGVLQAGPIASRSFPMFRMALSKMERAPKVTGIVLNMFDRQYGASIDVLSDACENLPGPWLFQTTIPRNDVFMTSSSGGLPLHHTAGAPSSVSWLFDMLAGEIQERLGLRRVQEQAAESFLL